VLGISVRGIDFLTGCRIDEGGTDGENAEDRTDEGLTDEEWIDEVATEGESTDDGLTDVLIEERLRDTGRGITEGLMTPRMPDESCE